MPLAAVYKERNISYISREALISRQILNRGAIEVVQKDRKRVFKQFGMPLKHHQCDRLFHRARVGRFEHARSYR